MSTNAKEARFREQFAQLELHRREMAKPADQRDESKLMSGRDRVRMRMRCKICGRGRAVYRKFGICRICFRDLASAGMIPGVRKASW